jgi:ribosomal protein S18 acetylase RimI-like enzyme
LVPNGSLTLARAGLRMSESWFMPDIESLAPRQWPTLRTIRLAALEEAPDSFLARYEDQRDWEPAQWRAEFVRGEWSIGFNLKKPISLLGCTREESTPLDECYLEYLWVSPEFRNTGIGYSMLVNAIERLRKAGVRTAFLWVLDGNEPAVRLYRRVGFVSGNYRQPLADRPGRAEELMRLDLD